MSLISKKSLIKRIRRSRQSRARLVASNLSEGIAYQIRATRDSQNLTQSELAERAEMTQGNLCRLESVEYGKHSVSSLKRIADALDVALVVRLVPFSQYIDWLSGTPHLDRGISSSAMSVESFEVEERSGKYDAPQERYFAVMDGAQMDRAPAQMASVGSEKKRASDTIVCQEDSDDMQGGAAYASG